MPELKAKFTADDSQFSAKVDGLKGKVGGLESVFGRLAGAFGGYKMLQFGQSIVTMASDAADASDSLGMLTDDFQTLQVMATKAGVPFEKLEQAINRIKQARLNAINDPSGKEAEKFDNLRISVAELVATGDDAAKLMAMLGVNMRKYAGDTKAAEAATELIGTRAKRVQKVFEEYGKAGVEGARDANRALIMSADSVEKLDKAGDSASLATRGAKVAVGETLVRALDFSRTKREHDALMKSLEAAPPLSENVWRKNNPNAVRGLLPPPEPEYQSTFGSAAARQITNKTLSDFNRVSDPFASIGRASGRDTSADVVNKLTLIEQNTRKPTGPVSIPLK
jgi:hypothetical protein